MMQPKPCRPYHAVLDGKTLLSLPGGKSAFKIYFVSLVGRPAPERYEWSRATISRDDFSARLQTMKIAGVGFVVAFPHIAKVFRFDPAMETILDVRAFRPSDFKPLDLQRSEGYMEFACYAEAILAADEYRLWAKAKTIGEYLAAFSPFEEGKIVSTAKLANYLA